jgi:hypothetical protein
MDTPQLQPANTEANIRKAAEAIAEVLQMKQEFIHCYDFVANNTTGSWNYSVRQNAVGISLKTP